VQAWQAPPSHTTLPGVPHRPHLLLSMVATCRGHAFSTLPACRYTSPTHLPASPAFQRCYLATCRRTPHTRCNTAATPLLAASGDFTHLSGLLQALLPAARTLYLPVGRCGRTWLYPSCNTYHSRHRLEADALPHPHARHLTCLRCWRVLLRATCLLPPGTGGQQTPRTPWRRHQTHHTRLRGAPVRRRASRLSLKEGRGTGHGRGRTST